MNAKQKWMLATTIVMFGAACQGNNPSGNTTNVTESSTEIERIQNRIAELSRQRTTPDQTVNSFFEVAALTDELACYRNEMARAYPPLRNRETETSGDAFFSGAALESRRRYRRTVAECLQRRERRSVDIQDVEMNTPTHATIMITLRNITPIPPDSEATELDRNRRRDGDSYRIQLSKSGNAWTIQQIYTRYVGSEEWRAQFTNSELYPSFAFLPVL